MTVTDSTDRQELLRTYGRWYGDERFAVAFTTSNKGDDAKKVTESWDKAKPLAHGEFGAGLVGQRGQRRNVAIVLRPSNLVVLECDSEEDLVRIEELKLPETITVRSSKPYKRHYYFRPPEELSSLPYVAFRFESGKLTADSGRYFLAPPSIHPSGSVYAFIPGQGPGEMDIAELPETTYRELSQSATVESDEQRHQIATDPEAKIRAGNRRDAIFRFACMQRRWGMPYQAILDACLQFNEAKCDPPVDPAFVRVQVDGAMKKRGDQEIAKALANPIPDHPEPDQAQPEPEVDEEEDSAPTATDALGSWTPLDLTAPEYQVEPDPPAVMGLFYLGRRHVLSGPPEAAKTLVAYAAIITALRQSMPVAIIDFEMGPTAAARLLREMGGTEDEIRSIHFVTPTEPPDTGLESIIQRGTQLVLIDAAIGAYDVSGLDDNARKDAEAFARQWIRPLWDASIATIVIDHVVKNTDSRGKFTIGSERKLGQADVHLGLEALKHITRGGDGLIKVHVHKDRPAFLPRPTATVVELQSNPTTHRVTWALRDPDPTDSSGEKRYTIVMENVSRWLEKQTDPATRADIEREVKGTSAAAKRGAMDTLTAEGYVIETAGSRGARLLQSTRPYRNADDPEHHENTTSSDLVPPRPDDLVPPRLTSSPSTEGTRRGQSTQTTPPRPDEDDEETQRLLNLYGDHQ